MAKTLNTKGLNIIFHTFYQILRYEFLLIGKQNLFHIFIKKIKQLCNMEWETKVYTFPAAYIVLVNLKTKYYTFILLYIIYAYFIVRMGQFMFAYFMKCRQETRKFFLFNYVLPHGAKKSNLTT